MFQTHCAIQAPVELEVNFDAKGDFDIFHEELLKLKSCSYYTV